MSEYANQPDNSVEKHIKELEAKAKELIDKQMGTYVPETTKKCNTSLHYKLLSHDCFLAKASSVYFVLKTTIL